MRFEQQFLSASGQALQGGAAFSRQAWVGLRHDRYGTLGVGRQYDSYTDTLGAYVSSNSWATPYGSHLGDVDNLNAAFNFNNAIRFTSADFHGLTFGGTFGFGGQAGISPRVAAMRSPLRTTAHRSRSASAI